MESHEADTFAELSEGKQVEKFSIQLYEHGAHSSVYKASRRHPHKPNLSEADRPKQPHNHISNGVHFTVFIGSLSQDLKAVLTTSWADGQIRKPRLSKENLGSGLPNHWVLGQDLCISGFSAR